jgi:hypothetical protein
MTFNQYPLRTSRREVGNAYLQLSFNGTTGQPGVGVTALASSSYGIRSVVPTGTSSFNVYLGDGITTGALLPAQCSAPYAFAGLQVTHISSGNLGNTPRTSNWFVDSTNISSGVLAVRHIPSGSVQPTRVEQSCTLLFDFKFFLADQRGRGRDGGI